MAEDLVFALYRDGEPDEEGILKGLAAVVQAMMKLNGREDTADFLERAAGKIRTGEIWSFGETGPWGTA